VTTWWPPLSSRALLVAAAVVLAVAIAAFGGWAWYDAAQRRANAAYAEALTRAQAADTPDAPSDVRVAAARQLEQILARYPSARPVPQAAYELGNLRFASRDFAGARAAYELAVQRGATGMLRTLARMGVARTWEAERDFVRAAEAYGALVRDLDPKSFAFEEVLLDHGRTLELAGRKPEAVAAYQRLLKEVPNARRADEVRSRLAALGTASR
jgi:tetratricopeptide (TPR) repeat protein